MPRQLGIGENPGAWTTVKIDGERYPGNCRVRGGKPLKCHKKEIPGTDTTQLTSLGFKSSPITLTFEIADLPGSTLQWDSFQRIATRLQPVKGQPIQGHDIQHPALNLYGINSLYLVSLGLPELRSEQEPDILIARVEMTQYSPVKVRKANTANASGNQNPATAASSVIQTNSQLDLIINGAVQDAASGQYVTPVPWSPAAYFNPSPAPQPTPQPSYNPAGGFDPAPASLDPPSASQANPPQYDPNGGFTP